MSSSLTNWTAGQNVQRKAGAEHAPHGFAAQRQENHSVSGHIQDCAFEIGLLTALNNRLNYIWKVKETSREVLFTNISDYISSLEIQAFVIYLLPIWLPSSFCAHLRYAFLSGFINGP